MSKQVIKEQIEDLRNKLNHYNYLYYVLDKPEVSDFEFDDLMLQLSDLEKNHPEFKDPLSPTNRVGGGLIDGFENVAHNQPMLSLSNTYSASELRDFDQRIKKKLHIDTVHYSCELKYDGVAISIIYKNGILHQAITRGDGLFGDDVTENIKTIKSIPLKLFGNYPNLLEMRGEVFIEKSVFNQINHNRKRKQDLLTKEYENNLRLNISNEEKEKIEKKYVSEFKKLDQYSNPRNFASGSLKLLDSSKVASRKLSCVLYAAFSDKLPHDNHITNLKESMNWGFKIPKHIKLAYDIEDVIAFTSFASSLRDSLPFEIDGVVVKVNNLNDQDLLGNTSKVPRWAISYKFKPSQVSTILENIKYQVGRTGAVTPVACLKPIRLAGSVIRRATLHNEDFIKNLI